MRDGHGQCIGGIVRLGHRGQMQHQAHHFHHLFFHGLAIAGERLLHLHGGVFINRHPALRRRQQDHTTRLGHADHRGLVVLIIQLLNGQCLGLIGFAHLLDALVHLHKALLKRNARLRAYCAEIHRLKTNALLLDHAPAHNGIAGVDA